MVTRRRGARGRGTGRAGRPAAGDAPRAPDAGGRMHPAYLETRFRLHGLEPRWPAAFGIVSAWPTTGRTWPRERIERADAALEAALRERGCWRARVTGYSPRTGHAEPSWAAALSFEATCELGLRFAQHAIWWVEGGVLFVSACGRGREPIRVGAFSERVEQQTGGEP